jgi:hypothetical protein
MAKIEELLSKYEPESCPFDEIDDSWIEDEANSDELSQ